MDKAEKYLEELLIFMADEIDNNGSRLKATIFDFSFSYTQKYMNAKDETFQDGEDLQKFKLANKLKDNKTIAMALFKGLNEKSIEHYSISGQKFSNLKLTDNGYRKSRAIRLNRKENKKKPWTYLFEKLIIPIVVALITALATSYVTNNEVNKKIETLEKDIKWIKQNK